MTSCFSSIESPKKTSNTQPTKIQKKYPRWGCKRSISINKGSTKLVKGIHVMTSSSIQRSMKTMKISNSTKPPPALLAQSRILRPLWSVVPPRDSGFWESISIVLIWKIWKRFLSTAGIVWLYSWLIEKWILLFVTKTTWISFSNIWFIRWELSTEVEIQHPTYWTLWIRRAFKTTKNFTIARWWKRSELWRQTNTKYSAKYTWSTKWW